MRIYSLLLDLNFKLSPIVGFFFQPHYYKALYKSLQKAKFSLNPFAEVNYSTFIFFFRL